MDQRQKSRVELLTRVALLTVTGVSLTACQKARMSTVQRPLPTQVAPVRTFPQPGMPVGPGGPGSIVPPMNRPPVVVTPPPVQPGGPVGNNPDQTIPTTSTPPTTEVIVSVPPAIPSVTPAPTRTQPPTTVYTPAPIPAPAPAPAPAPTQPSTSTPGTTVVQTPQIFTPQPTTGGVAVTPIPQRTTTVTTGGTLPTTPAPLPVPTGTVRVETPISMNTVPTCEGVSCLNNKPTATSSGSTVQAPVISLRPRQLDKVDILFVVDTSASMKAERKAIMSQLKEFTRHFDDEVDYSVSILLGHGPRSNAAIEKTGQFVRTGSLYMGQFTESRVQFSQLVERAKRHMLEKSAGASLSKEDLTRFARAQAAEEIGQRLADAIDQAPNDRTDAQGEAGLLNLYTALTKNRTELERYGTLRRGAGLVVFFIADENDICFDYARAQKQGLKLTPHFATAQDKAAETRAFNDSDTCARVVNNSQRLTEEAVLDALKAAKGNDPVIVSGVLYLDDKSVADARRANDRYKGDNETGHGYLDLIGLAHGEAADLSGANFGRKMYELGKLSDFKLKYDTVFQIQGARDTNSIDEKSVRVTIVNEQGQSQTLNPKDVKLEIIDERHAQVVVDAKALEKIINGNGRKLNRECQVHITYSVTSSRSNLSGQQQDQKATQGAEQTTAPIEASKPSTVIPDKNPYELEFNH